MSLEIANQCLLCKVPRCRQNCPIDTPIPEVIKLYKEGNYQEAGKILFENNPLSAVCALVCPHEDQCAGHCVKGIKGNPVEFYKIEQELSSNYLETLEIPIPMQFKDRIAIIGGGPAGITIAFILAQRGYKVTLFDAHERIGGVLRYGIPEYRLPKHLVDVIEDNLVRIGVKIRPNTLIGPVITLDRLLEDGYKAVFIGTGVWNPKALNIKGETLGNAHFAIDFLKSPSTFHLGKKVAVIGAGNVAMDAAQMAKRNGCDVTILYRKGFEQMPATKFEIQEAKENGINFHLFRAPLEITEEGVRLGLTENVEDENGRIVTKILEGQEEFFECDSVIIAVSQSPKANIIATTKELEVNRFGLLITDDFGNTTKEGTFASGDVVTGAKTVVQAVARAKIVAETIDEYCKTH